MRVWQGVRRHCNVSGVTFEQRFEGGEQVCHVGVWGKNVPGRMNSRCKGPGTGACLVCWKNTRGEYAESGVIERGNGRRENLEVTEGSDRPGLRCCCKNIAFYSVKWGPIRGF